MTAARGNRMRPEFPARSRRGGCSGGFMQRAARPRNSISLQTSGAMQGGIRPLCFTHMQAMKVEILRSPQQLPSSRRTPGSSVFAFLTRIRYLRSLHAQPITKLDYSLKTPKRQDHSIANSPMLITPTPRIHTSHPLYSNSNYTNA
jgi:hypothetical protein